MNYWLHRISNEWEISYPLFQKGFLSLGWNVFSSSNILDLITNNGEDGFNLFMSEKCEKRRSRWNLWYFSQFKVGDIVVVPLYNKEFAICEVMGAPFSVLEKHGMELENMSRQNVSVNERGFFCQETNQCYDIGFLVQIKELRRIPRSYTEADLIARMKMRQANGCIDNLAKSVDEALQAQAPTSLHDAIMGAATDNICDTLKKHLTPDNLERVIKWYMKKMGAEKAYIPPKNEHDKKNGADADIIAEFENLRTIFYIQTKKHVGETNEWAIQQISEYHQQKQNDTDDYTYIPWAVSTAEFSEIAILKAEESNVRLIGGKELIQMLLNCGINDIDEALKN